MKLFNLITLLATLLSASLFAEEAPLCQVDGQTKSAPEVTGGESQGCKVPEGVKVVDLEALRKEQQKVAEDLAERTQEAEFDDEGNPIFDEEEDEDESFDDENDEGEAASDDDEDDWNEEHEDEERFDSEEEDEEFLDGEEEEDFDRDEEEFDDYEEPVDEGEEGYNADEEMDDSNASLNDAHETEEINPADDEGVENS